MATNWNAILSNANSLNDILMILRKVLAGLDAKADVTLIDEALDDIGNLKIDVDGAIDTINQAILDFENTGGYITAANFSELNLITPSYDFQLARAEDTGDEYRWDTSASPSPAWIPTGRNYLQDAINYANTNAVFKPLLNPAEKNQNNVGYSVAYYSVAADITLANNFPVASTPTFVLTYKLSGTSVTYQRAILPFVSPIRSFERSNTGSWSAWVEGTNKAAVDALSTIVNNNAVIEKAFESKVFSQTGKNKLDKSKIVDGEYLSLASATILASANYKRSDFIPVAEGQQYYLSGTSTSGTIIGWYAVADKTATALSVTNARTGTAPSGAKYAIVNITGDGTTTYNATAQFEVGTVATSYEAYSVKIKKSDVQDGDKLLLQTDILEQYSFNKINPSKVDFSRRYSTGSKGFVTDSNPIAASAFISVMEGEWYTVSGTAIYGLPTSVNCQGGYFTSNTATTAVANITFVAPVSGTGACFKVPTGQGITHVVISLDKTAGNVLDGTAQMEVGEMPTIYQAYNEVPRIKDSLVPNSSEGGGSNPVAFDNATWYKYVNADGAKIFQDMLPKFRKAMLLKNQDVVVVNTGTSLTARTSEHSSLHSEAAFRPPMMHSKAFCSHIWDALRWEGQQYRRYDAAYFTETGTFATSSNLAEWDDGAARDGLTRYSSDVAASIQFAIPVGAWQFNFIYRTDSVGCDAKITITEGAGKVQVFDELTQAWVEANNYTFNQLEATPVTRSVVIPSAVSSSTQTVTCASKGNTTYQKRLKMRCRGDNSTFDSLAVAKSVTIARVGGGSRFMYWGVEWSPRQYMITYINAARGSHNTSATGALGLPRFQDNEIWSFKPTLILSELGIHNDGAAGSGIYPVGTWQGLSYNYVNNLNFELSMFSRAAYFNNTAVEYAFFTASIAWNFGGINEDGTLKYSLQTSSEKGPARMMSALDKYQEATEYLNSVGIPCVDAAKRWVDAGYALFGSMKDATVGSGKNGNTFTNEGSHWNDTGSMIIAKAVIPLVK
ncbi:hypothetical protein V6760_03745 [Acinetobacter venetianus]